MRILLALVKDGLVEIKGFQPGGSALLSQRPSRAVADLEHLDLERRVRGAETSRQGVSSVRVTRGGGACAKETRRREMDVEVGLGVLCRVEKRSQTEIDTKRRNSSTPPKVSRSTLAWSDRAGRSDGEDSDFHHDNILRSSRSCGCVEVRLLTAIISRAARHRSSPCPKLLPSSMHHLSLSPSKSRRTDKRKP